MSVPQRSRTGLRTERLLLRQWRAEDREPFFALNADPEVMEHFPATLTREESDAFAAQSEADIDRQGWGLWAVEVAEGPDAGAFAGFVGFKVPRFDAHFMPAVEIAWRLARWSWGRGFATEAAREALDFGFTHIGFGEVVSFTAVPNVRSQAVMRRLGMTHDPDDDFDHPVLPEGHRLRRHVLYRARSAA
ncbi:GNAT family N-acetyltransferase [Motilibacter deserti]|uniref:GNAT family N-acetyltransferase n=1 Tax=Motilibacter deserti TaxID=2714956 RepID=UPI002F2B7F29